MWCLTCHPKTPSQNLGNKLISLFLFYLHLIGFMQTSSLKYFLAGKLYLYGTENLFTSFHLVDENLHLKLYKKVKSKQPINNTLAETGRQIYRLRDICIRCMVSYNSFFPCHLNLCVLFFPNNFTVHSLSIKIFCGNSVLSGALVIGNNFLWVSFVV